MKKSLILIIGILIAGGFISNVNAQECVYGLQSISIPYNGSWVHTKVRSYKTSANVCLAKNITVKFAPGSFLENTYFTIEAKLMEDDPEKYEPDEWVKKYKGVNRGLNGFTWSLEDTNNANLDSVGDQTCELYMMFRTSEFLYQNGYFEPDMFRFTICVD